MRLDLMLQAALILVIGVAVGLFHASRSDHYDGIQSLTATWKRLDARNAQTSEPPVDQTANADGNDTAPPDSSDPGDSGPTDSDDPAMPNTDGTAGATGTESTDGGLDLDALEPEIGMTEAVALYDLPGVMFVDAREYSRYKAGHIANAIAMPYEVVREGGELPHVENQLIVPGETRLIIYCRGGDCDESHLVAEELRMVGFTCHVFLDGYPAWRDAGHPTSEGSDMWLQSFGAEPEG